MSNRNEHRRGMLQKGQRRDGSVSANCLQNPEYGRLAAQAVEVKRMLSSRKQKVKAVN